MTDRLPALLDDLALVQDEVLTLSEQEALLKKSLGVRRVLTASKSLDVRVQEALARDKDLVAMKLAENPCLDAAVVAMLVERPQAHVRIIVSLRGDLSEEQVALLARDASASVRRAISGHARLGAEDHTLLARDGSCDVRVGVAHRSDLSTAAQEILCRDDSLEVLCTLARKPNLCPAAQLVLASDGSEKVREELALSGTTLVFEALALLTADRRPHVQEMIYPSLLADFDRVGEIDARYAQKYFPGPFKALTMDVDTETLHGLLIGWEGNLASLVEACCLVGR